MHKPAVHQKYNSEGNYHFNTYSYENHVWAPHFHRGYELVYLFEGEITLTVSGVSERLHGGDFALILSNQIHDYADPKHVKMRISVFSEQYVPYFSRTVQGKRAKTLAFRTDAETERFILNGLCSETDSILRRKAWMYAVCDAFLREVPLTGRKSKNDWMICQLLDYISENFAEDITLKSAAEYFGYEYHYLSRVLNGSYNISFRKTVNQYRVEAALDKLEKGGAGMAEIAAASGFQSIRSFNYVFKSVTGQTPTEYLK